MMSVATMSRRRDKAGFALRELIVVLFICVLVIGLLLPAISIWRANRDRNACFDKLRNLGLALHNYESINRRYPVVIFNDPSLADPARNCRPGDASGGKATTGYSWILAIEPMLCDSNIFIGVSQASEGFTIKTGPFTPKITNRDATDQHVSCIPLPMLICPAWAGDGYTNSRTTIDVGPSRGAPPSFGAPEYANVDSNALGVGARAFKGKVAPTNYKPMVGTHMRNGVPVENGGMLLTGSKGLTEGAFSDGTSKTILLCETKESGYASWYDGTLNWLVGNDPNQPPPGSGDNPPWIGASLAINRGFDPNVAGSVPYLKRMLTANSPQNDVAWGPSSDHSGGIVSHVYADGHTLGVTENCDAYIYLGLVTRSGSEPIDEVLYYPGGTTTTGVSTR